MKEIVIEIPGKPQGKARPRVVRNKYTGKAHGITPQNTQDYESLIRWAWKAAGGVDFGEALLAYRDDAQVVKISCEKKYAENGAERVVVNVSEMGGGDM